MNNLISVAEDMAETYITCPGKVDAVAEVATKHPDVDASIISAMWEAIYIYQGHVDEMQ